MLSNFECKELIASFFHFVLGFPPAFALFDVSYYPHLSTCCTVDFGGRALYTFSIRPLDNNDFFVSTMCCGVSVSMTLHFNGVKFFRKSEV